MLRNLVNANPNRAIAILLLVATIFACFAAWQRRGHQPWTYIASDAQWYYAYLPATFIYGFEEHPTSLEHHTFAKYPGTNIVFTKYTCGVAIMEAPFFGLAHAVAKLTGRPTTGYNGIYGAALFLAALTYCLLGLLLLFRVLCRHFETWIALLMVAAVFFGTNLGYYTYGESGMSHAYSFFLFAAFAWLTPKVLQQPSITRIALLSLILGLVVLIRPTNIILALYLIGHNTQNLNDLKNRIQWIFKQLKYLPIAIVVVAVVLFPQLLYWHAISGDWVHWSYNQEGFDNWNAPKIWQVLFHVQNGLFVYAPVMLLALAGLVLTNIRKTLSAPVQALLFVLATYTFGSWWAWWFGGAFGHRSYVEFFALLAIPAAYTLQALLKSPKWYWRTATYAFMLCSMYYTSVLALAYAPPWDGPDWTWKRFYDVGLRKLL